MPQNSISLATTPRRASLPLLSRAADNNNEDAGDDDNGDRDDDLPLMQADCGAH